MKEECGTNIRRSGERVQERVQKQNKGETE